MLYDLNLCFPRHCRQRFNWTAASDKPLLPFTASRAWANAAAQADAKPCSVIRAGSPWVTGQTARTSDPLRTASDIHRPHTSLDEGIVEHCHRRAVRHVPTGAGGTVIRFDPHALAVEFDGTAGCSLPAGKPFLVPAGSLDFRHVMPHR